jgi:hypothetical protein
MGQIGLGKALLECAHRMVREARLRLDLEGDDAWIDANAYRYREAAGALYQDSLTLHRWYERVCNAPMTADERHAIRRLEAHAGATLHEIGLDVVFQRDPRGAPIHIAAAPENADSFGGETIVVPWLPASDYDDRDGDA